MLLLCIDISHSKKGIFSCQCKYTLDILSYYSTRLFSFFFSNGTIYFQMMKTTSRPVHLSSSHMSSSTWLSLILIFNMSWIISMQNPSSTHLDAAHHILCYLKGYFDKGIPLSTTNSLFLLSVFCSLWLGWLLPYSLI